MPEPSAFPKISSDSSLLKYYRFFRAFEKELFPRNGGVLTRARASKIASNPVISCLPAKARRRRARIYSPPLKIFSLFYGIPI